MAEIRAADEFRPGDLALEDQAHIAAAGGEIQNAPRASLRHAPGQSTSPAHVGAQAQEAIEQVIAPTDAGEHLPDGARFPEGVDGHVR